MELNVKLKQPELHIIIGASRQQREIFLKNKEPFLKASWERYVNNLNREAHK